MARSRARLRSAGAALPFVERTDTSPTTLPAAHHQRKDARAYALHHAMLLTGMSGAGKSALVQELRRRGIWPTTPTIRSGADASEAEASSDAPRHVSARRIASSSEACEAIGLRQRRE